LPRLVANSIDGIALKIDKSGRTIFPNRLRERLGLKPDTELETVDQFGGALLCPVEQRPSMIQVDGLWVHRGAAESGADWDSVLEDAREERVQSVLKA